MCGDLKNTTYKHNLYRSHKMSISVVIVLVSIFQMANKSDFCCIENDIISIGMCKMNI